jgi:hypothetical protein
LWRFGCARGEQKRNDKSNQAHWFSPGIKSLLTFMALGKRIAAQAWEYTRLEIICATRQIFVIPA